MILEDPILKVYAVLIVYILDISEESDRNNLHKPLNIIKICVKWMRHLLNVDQKQTRQLISQQWLGRFKYNQTVFMYKFVTRDETRSKF